LSFLSAGHEIKAHVDYDTTLICRYHIPILTNPDVKFFVQRGTSVHEFHMPADGNIYFFNQGLKHWVKNDGNTPRLHLIIDVHGQVEIDDMTPIEGKVHLI
jgi:aspartyl/asparaginyl beta-hydroxylase (cupin superfamily)